MRFMYWGKDGGPDSTVWGFWPIELKNLFSIALLRFDGASRDIFHTHAFNSVSWLLKGLLIEEFPTKASNVFRPNLKPIITKRTDLHQVHSKGRSWALTFRGPWVDQWHESNDGKGFTTLTHGRKVI